MNGRLGEISVFVFFFFFGGEMAVSILILKWPDFLRWVFKWAYGGGGLGRRAPDSPPTCSTPLVPHPAHGTDNQSAEAR